MKFFLKSLTLTCVFLTFNYTSAHALFGSECRKPKASYQNLVDAAEKARIQELARAEAYVIPKIDIQLEVKNCLAKGNATKNACKLAAEDKQRAANFLKTPNFSAELIQKKRAAKIIVNYKKCFDPIKVIYAQEILQKNK